MKLQDIVTRILQTIGVINASDPANTNDVALVISIMNTMKNSWSSEGLAVYFSTREAFPLTIGKESYLWGPASAYFAPGYFEDDYFGGTSSDWDSPRPERILHAWLTDANNNSFPISIESMETYNGITNKDNQGLPFLIAYNPTYPLGTVFVYYTAGDTYNLHIDSEKLLPDFDIANLTLDVDLPPPYQKALIYNAGMEACAPFERQVPPVVAQEAEKSLMVLKRVRAAQRNKGARLNLFPVPQLGFYKRVVDIRGGGF